MFMSRPISARATCGMRRHTRCAWRAGIIGDATLRLVLLRITHRYGSHNISMLTFTISPRDATRPSGIGRIAARRGAPNGTPGGDVCAHENHIARGSELRAKSSRWDARDYRGIPAFATEVGAVSSKGLGDRLQSWKIGAEPDAGRRTT